MMPATSSRAGMSLIEVLVALFILALASAAIMMTLPRHPSRLDREVTRLERAIDQLAGEAIAAGEVRAIQLTPDGYQAQAWRGGRWVALKRSRHMLPSPLRAHVQNAPKEMKDWPEIVADTTGIVSARTLVLADGAERRVLTVSASGAVGVER